MAHIVSRKGYLSLEESYRDPVTGKPRKRYLRYIGKRSSDPQARYQQMIDTAERKAEEIADKQRAMFGESGEERQEREKEEAKFSQEKFLESTTSPAPAEPPAAGEPQEPDANSPDGSAGSDTASDDPGSDD